MSILTRARFACQLVLAIAIAMATSAVLNAATYNVVVTRLSSNLYQDQDSKTIIETKYCYEYATRDEAVLRWEGRYGTNWIVFNSGTKCDVVALR